jgi:radical SAM family uncharacterized protein/radical SAM-linked protein
MKIAQEKLFEIFKKVEKPSRYLGQEVNAIVKDLSQVELKVALVMPETYEIGQSNLGLKILYEILNKIPNVAAERVYAPWIDFEKELREQKIPLFSLENKIPLSEFDLIGISLPYELSYTNILTILDLAGIPRRASERKNIFPLILGGGNQAFNPEPIADFFDAFVVGDGEEAIVEIVEKILEFKGRGGSRTAPTDFQDAKVRLLRDLTKIQGFYVPSFFEISYHPDQTIAGINPFFSDYIGVNKATVKDLDQALVPSAPVVPSMKTIHDRLAVEVQRGCVRGCRFCQAGYIYRPERQRSPGKVLEIIEEGMSKTGAEEISLLSLSVGDYGCLVPLVRELFDRYEKKKVSISLPATRTDTFSPELIQEIKRVRKTGFTIAPEAGTPRMRRIINKGNSREDLFQTVEKIFSEGWQLVKFYYMCGLPFETFEDLAGIAEEGEGALKIGRRYSSKTRIHLSVSPHVPKPFTPFQWEAQDSIETTRKKIGFLKSKIKDRGIDFKYHGAEQSYLEGVFARGDRRLAKVIEKAWELGCRFDGWNEGFDFEKWQEAFRLCGIDSNFYVTRARARDEVFPWDHLFRDMKKEFLWAEREAASKEAFIPDCSTGRCTPCGICDFHEVKNVNYKVESSPSPWMGEGQEEGDLVMSHQKVVKFSTRGRKLEEKEFDLKRFEGRRESPRQSLPKVFTSYRCRFTKLGEVAFLSHLEVMGVLKRALARAEVPIRFSEGYHPQPRLSLGQALPVGVESLSEFFDIEVAGLLDPTGFVHRMNQVLPRGLEIKSCEPISHGTPSLSVSMVRTVWKVDFSQSYPGGRERLDEKAQWLKEQSELMVIRHREQGDRKINIRPFIASIDSLSDRSLSLVTRNLPNGSARPQEVLKHLLEDSEEMLAAARVTKVDSLLNDPCPMN